MSYISPVTLKQSKTKVVVLLSLLLAHFLPVSRPFCFLGRMSRKHYSDQIWDEALIPASPRKKLGSSQCQAGVEQGGNREVLL